MKLSKMLIKPTPSNHITKTFNCLFLSCHVRVSELVYTLQSPECQGTTGSKQTRDIWSLSDCNWIRTQNHLVRKRTINHLAKLIGCGFGSHRSHLKSFNLVLHQALIINKTPNLYSVIYFEINTAAITNERLL